jgi:tetratricopeptide (TPR) repeat protein
MALVVRAMALIELTRYAEAEALLRDSVSRLERSRGPEHAQLLYPLMHLFTTMKRSGRTAEALELNRRVLALQEKHLGGGHLLVGRALADRGDTLRRLGRLEEAEVSFRRAALVLEPLRNQELGLLMLFRGRLRMDQGRFGEAEQAFARAEDLYRATLGERAVETWGARSERGAALVRLGRLAEGKGLQEEAVDRVRGLAGEASPAYAELHRSLEETRQAAAR